MYLYNGITLPWSPVNPFSGDWWGGEKKIYIKNRAPIQWLGASA